MFREDIVTKMCRNCVKFPEDGDVPTHVSIIKGRSGVYKAE